MRRSIIPFVSSNYSPISLVQDFDREFDNFFDSIQNLRSSYPPAQSSVRESDDAYFASIDMPGMKASDIDIQVKDNYISIEAERKDVDGQESVYRKFSQRFSLPQNIEASEVESHYENGVLSLVFPKTKKSVLEGKKVNVLTGEKPKKWMDFFGKKEDKSKKEDKKVLN
jgi:HSP20 family protein